MVLTLAAVVGLNGADTSAISATAGNLEQAFGFGNTALGMLVSVVSLSMAVFTLPAGILTDRTRRTRLLGSASGCGRWRCWRSAGPRRSPG